MRLEYRIYVFFILRVIVYSFYYDDLYGSIPINEVIQGHTFKRLTDYLMLSLFEEGGDITMSFESDMGLTTPPMRFLLQSPLLPSELSLEQVTLPVRSIRSSRARLLLTLLCWISLTGEKFVIEISSSLAAGLEYNF